MKKCEEIFIKTVKMPKHSCFAFCNSDSRYAYKEHMNGVFFIPFPKLFSEKKKVQEQKLSMKTT